MSAQTETAGVRREPHFLLAMKRYWDLAHVRKSVREGWILTNDSNGCYTISRIDNPEDWPEFTGRPFTDDREAQEFVCRKALQGSKTHLLAVYLEGHTMDQEFNIEPPDFLVTPPNANHILRLLRLPQETTVVDKHTDTTFTVAQLSSLVVGMMPKEANEFLGRFDVQPNKPDPSL